MQKKEMSNFLKITPTLILALIATISAQDKPASIRYAWNYVNFTWPSYDEYNEALSSGNYTLESCFVAGVQVWKDRMFLSFPRVFSGVPVTLGVVPVEPGDDNKSPNVAPYPNWSMQKLGDCAAFQCVQGIEIDALGRLWILDSGRAGIFEKQPGNYCPARLVVIDLENNDEVVLEYVFPEDVALRESTFLINAVLDKDDGGFAYISDEDPNYPGVIVFSVEDKASWKITHETMKAKDINLTIKYDNTQVLQPVNIVGLAISPPSLDKDKRLLYYSPLSSLEIFTIPTRILKDRSVDTPESYVESLGKKPSQSDGMLMTTDGLLYYGHIITDEIGAWDTKTAPFETNQRVAFQDIQLQYPHSFDVDAGGTLWCTANNLHRYFHRTVDTGKTNLRVVKLAESGTKSYHYYYEDGSPASIRIG